MRKEKIDFQKLKKILPGIKENIPLKDYTTFKIGGPAKYFYTAKTKKDLIKAIKMARKYDLSFFVIGEGSGLLAADKGFNGLVIKNEIRFIKILKTQKKINLSKVKLSYIQTKPASRIKTLSFSDLDYQDKGEPVFLRVGAGLSLGYLLDYTLKNGITGLQWFSGIPGTVGGAVFCNAHGGTRYIGEYVANATLIDQQGRCREVDNTYLGFSYRQSILKKTKEIVADATMRLYKGDDVARAREVAREWLERKCLVQPRKNTAGSIFQNVYISNRTIKQFQKNKISLTPEMVSNKIIPAGWLIDKCGLKGKRIGNAQVSEKHANFIVNTGEATADDVIQLIKLIKAEVKKKFDIELREVIALSKVVTVR